MKELDVMLERFMAGPESPLGSAAGLAAFEELLELPDPLLAAYLLGGNTPPQRHLAELAQIIRTYVAKQARAALS
jgi:succinate dehydrogenase flavin-adding protein (antitoxin of CptAB toxin-antitoxin module)